MAKKIRTGDSVMVISGGCKGSTGIVKSVEGNRAIVDGVNKKMKHIRRTSQSAGRVEAFFASIDISNLAHCINNKPIKVGFKIDNDGKKSLINKKTSERIRFVW